MGLTRLFLLNPFHQVSNSETPRIMRENRWKLSARNCWIPQKYKSIRTTYQFQVMTVNIFSPWSHIRGRSYSLYMSTRRTWWQACFEYNQSFLNMSCVEKKICYRANFLSRGTEYAGDGHVTFFVQFCIFRESTNACLVLREHWRCRFISGLRTDPGLTW